MTGSCECSCAGGGNGSSSSVGCHHRLGACPLSSSHSFPPPDFARPQSTFPTFLFIILPLALSLLFPRGLVVCYQSHSTTHLSTSNSCRHRSPAISASHGAPRGLITPSPESVLRRFALCSFHHLIYPLQSRPPACVRQAHFPASGDNTYFYLHSTMAAA